MAAITKSPLCSCPGAPLVLATGIAALDDCALKFARIADFLSAPASFGRMLESAANVSQNRSEMLASSTRSFGCLGPDSDGVMLVRSRSTLVVTTGAGELASAHMP